MQKVTDFTFADVRNELFRLKSKEMKTNFFMSEIQFNELSAQGKIQFFKAENYSFLLVKDEGFLRLYFIVSKVESLAEILNFVNTHFKETITSETAGNNDYLANIKEVFLTQGFYEYSSMVRMSKIRSELENVNFEHLHLLTSEKKDEILGLFHKYFDKFVERIPTEQEIDRFIENKNAYYFSDNSEIQGFIIFEPHGITSHLRYWFVHPEYREKRIGSKLIALFFNLGENVKRELFWVIESNQNAIKRYRHFGFVEEDMHNLILINKNIKYAEPNS